MSIRVLVIINQMNAKTKKTISQLSQKGIRIEKGLSESEIKEIEQTYGFEFPPDLEHFLLEALPVGDRFPDWRDRSNPSLRHKLDWPITSILFDVQNNNFWWREWQEKPARLTDQLALAESYLRNYPRMIPLYAHRYLPSCPKQIANPVYSIYQTDIIIYGDNLFHYFQHEFRLKIFQKDCSTPNDLPRNETPFWTELYKWSNGL
jgi:hypothetical protein